VWSPDGTKIAFTWAKFNVSAGVLQTDLGVMNADGSNPRRITPDGFLPDWQPIPGPQRSDYKNAAQFCKADREFLGDASFTQKYGGDANAYGKCVSQNH
jgi:Tol biopolymer transport system component